ncbi:VanZ family protein [Intrasporangium flavum]|uniref:VanZ family protein n=1 Tax=Intrasporangium flavum TaxID=1428657 RepID=UPI00096D2026|nr:VanZ family protein [Intrasporangium flavum]
MSVSLWLAVVVLAWGGWALWLVQSFHPLSPHRTTTLVGLFIAGLAIAVWQDMPANVNRWLASNDHVMPVVLLVATVLVIVVLRRRRWPLRLVSWQAVALLLVGFVSLTERWHNPSFQGLGNITSCVAEAQRWLPGTLADLPTDLLPNAFLFAPVGLGLALMGLPWTRILGYIMAASVTIELYQALFTTRVCAPRDVVCNLAGAALGALTVRFLVQAATSTRPVPDERSHSDRPTSDDVAMR